MKRYMNTRIYVNVFKGIYTDLHTDIKVKKVIKHYAMKAWGDWMYRSTFFLTSALFGGVVSFTPWPLYPRGMEPPVPIG
jgi:hypothetical protein